MKKVTAFLLAFSLLFSMAVIAAAEEEIPYEVYPEAPGSYTAINDQTFYWTCPENGTFTFTIDSASNWEYYVRVGDVGGGYASYNGESTDRTVTCQVEAGTFVMMWVGYLSDDGSTGGTVDFSFSFTPDGTGTGGYITECTHHISGDGSYEAPFVYGTVADMEADWANRKIANSEIVYITAPLGGETLNVQARDTYYDEEADNLNIWFMVPYADSEGGLHEYQHWVTTGSGSYTFDDAAFAEIPITQGYRNIVYTLAKEPWSEGEMITLTIFGGVPSSWGFTAVTLTVDTDAGSGDGEEPVYSLGDVNDDGRIDTVDAFFVIACYNDAMDLTDDQLAAADVNADGKVDTVDAFYIVAYYNDAIDIFPAEK